MCGALAVVTMEVRTIVERVAIRVVRYREVREVRAQEAVLINQGRMHEDLLVR